MPLLKLHHISFRVMAVAGCIEWVKMTHSRHSRTSGSRLSTPIPLTISPNTGGRLSPRFHRHIV